MLEARKLWSVLGRLATTSGALQPTDMETFVSELLGVAADGPCADLGALVSLHSLRSERVWITARNVVSAEHREKLFVDGSDPVYVKELEYWVASRRFGPNICVALFKEQAAAAASSDDVTMLADVLALGLAMQRRREDSELMRRLATAPTREGKPRDAIHSAMATIARHMRSDGAKIYLARRTAAGPCFEIFSRTDLDPTGFPEPYPVHASRGLADWVLLHDDTIIIDDSVSPEQVETHPERCRTRRHGVIEVFGRPGRDQDPRDPTGDRERVLLLVPMRDQERVVGVLSFWRFTNDTYDLDLDLTSAENLAAQLVPICQSIVASEVREAVARELAKLGAMSGRSTRDVYTSVVASAGALARGVAALLFIASEHGVLYGMSEWIAAKRHSSPVFFSIRGIPSAWTNGAPPEVLERIHQSYSGYRVRPRPLLLTAADTRAISGVVFVMDRVEELPIRTCDDGLAEHEAGSFLRQVGPIAFGSYARVFAASMGPRLREAAPAPDRTSWKWASAVAQIIREIASADAVLIYQREHGELKVMGASAGHNAVLGLSAGRSSLTAQCLADGRHRFIPDVSDWSDPDAKLLNRETLLKITNALGWNGVRSWYCQPVIGDGPSLGAIKLLTLAGGLYLDPSSVEVVTAIATQLGSEMARHFKTEVLEDLNQVAERLSGKEGQKLAEAMIQQLIPWAHRFVDEDCSLAVIASVYTRQASVFAASAELAPRTFETANATQLAALSSGPVARRPEPFVLPEGLQRACQQSIPISLPGNPMLRGCLLFITRQPMGPQATAAAAEAAREIALFLDYEQRSRLRIEQTARFRHALLGPVQGLLNQADELTIMIADGVTDPDVLRDVAAMIRSEANQVALWRETQRLYATDQVRVVPRIRPLRPIVERCVERFRPPIQAERSGTLLLEFRPKGELDIPIDEPAIELVLNNLLDNARKYAFSHTTVTVTVESTRHLVRVIVEDIGHGIPHRLHKRIYEVGERLDWEDPVRSITGTGLGLPISQRIIEAHGGHLFHECDYGLSASDPNRCRVRFFLELPSGWKK